MERFFVMLTFDLEEFDIPEEFGQRVSPGMQNEITLDGMNRLRPVLERHEVPATFFTTGHFALSNPGLVQALADRHEIASHAMYHSPSHAFSEDDIGKSVQALKSVTGLPVTGFRMPRLKSFDQAILRRQGILYDSSLNPTYLPGRYNRLKSNPDPHLKGALLEIPCSVTPLIRFPLFWLSFKNLPAMAYERLALWTLHRRKNLMLYFHPWEFADLKAYHRLPRYIRNPDGHILAGKLERLIVRLLKEGATFITGREYYDYFLRENTDQS